MREINNYLDDNFKTNQSISLQKLISFLQSTIERNWLNIKVELKIDDTLKKKAG